MSTTTTRPGSRPRRMLAGAVTTALAASTLALLPASAQAADPAAAVVTVSTTTLRADGAQSVVVTGSGFDPSLATGTRPPLMGQPSGAYVGVGKFAATWRPSADAPSASRKLVSASKGGQKWAVPAESMSAVGGDAAGAIELKPDGTFSTTLTVSKTDIDALVGLDASHVNYGIYTYAGGGAKTAAYETYTPITFVAAPAVVPPAQANVSVKRGATKKPTTKKTGKTSLTVKAANGVSVNGKVTVTFKQKGEKTKTKTATVKNGKARVTIPKLAKGTWKVSVKFLGTSLFKKSATLQRGSFTVTK